MTTDHGQLQRSRHGQNVRSPQGQFDDVAPLFGHPRTDLLLSVVFIDEALYEPETILGMGYIPEPHDPPTDPAPGLARWDHDFDYWAEFEPGHMVVGWLIHVTGLTTGSDQLTPNGKSNPQNVHFTSENRPVSSLTTGLRVGLDRVRDRIVSKTGGEPNIKGLSFTVDATGSMSRNAITGAPGAFSAFGDGRDATALIELLTNEMRGRDYLAEDVELLPTQYVGLERWVQWSNRRMAAFYGLRTPEGP